MDLLVGQRGQQAGFGLSHAVSVTWAVTNGYTYAVRLRNGSVELKNDKSNGYTPWIREEGRFAFIQRSVTPRCQASPSA